MYQVLIEKQAQKQLDKIPELHLSRIKKAILNLCENPRPKGYKKLRGRPGYRIRIGDYRVIYTVEDNVLKVFILEVGNRKNIYD